MEDRPNHALLTLDSSPETTACIRHFDKIHFRLHFRDKVCQEEECSSSIIISLERLCIKVRNEYFSAYKNYIK